MRFGLQTWGTDGDIHPFLALGAALVAAGHEATLSYASVEGKDYSAPCQALGIGHLRTECHFGPAYPFIGGGRMLPEMRRLFATYYEPITDALYQDSLRLCDGSDAVIGHMVMHTLATAAMQRSIPRAAVVLCPVAVMSGAYNPQGWALPAVLNRAIWAVGDRVLTHVLFDRAKALRKASGLPPVRSIHREVFTSETLTLVAASPSLCPPPRDWPGSARITGAWALPGRGHATSLPDGVEAFLAAGTLPVALTFGSCAESDRGASSRLLHEAARLSGQRCIVQSSIPVPDGDDDEGRILWCGHVPHTLLFPRCAAVVHHAGAGTSHAALTAGCPSVPVPHIHDQPYWARQLHAIGVASPPIHRRHADAAAIAQRIRLVMASEAIRQQASRMGASLQMENGTAAAVRSIEEAFG